MSKSEELTALIAEAERLTKEVNETQGRDAWRKLTCEYVRRIYGEDVAPEVIEAWLDHKIEQLEGVTRGR